MSLRLVMTIQRRGEERVGGGAQRCDGGEACICTLNCLQKLAGLSTVGHFVSNIHNATCFFKIMVKLGVYFICN